MNFSFFLAMGLVLWVGGNRVIDGRISVGTLATFLTFMTILQMPVRQLGLLVNSFARASTCGTRLFELLDLDLGIKDEPGAKDLVVTDGVLRFEDVDFPYPGAGERKVLSGISFEARRGETIGIVGSPGAGKSSLVHLIPRFYDVGGGRITIDGQDISKVTLDSLRQSVGIVQQDSFLFTTSIENNIVYGNPWAKDDQIARASKSAQLHNYILGLPAGYGTVVGERGASLSGGQRQRLSIARSLMLKPAIMVFDDSTAAIDAGTEQRIRSAMRRFAKDRVTLVIAHRLSSLMHADRILFLEDGRIVERGTHEELLAKGGRLPRALRPSGAARRRRRAAGGARMSEKPEDREEVEDRRRRPPRAVVGSHRPEEEVFGAAFDAAHRPPHLALRVSVSPEDGRRGRGGAALHPEPGRHPAHHPLRDRPQHGDRQPRRPGGGAIAFAAAILINYGASCVQETVVGKAAEDVLFDMRRAMFEHLQRVSLSFMDKTEVGRLMSRLQGDVNSMQEFMETSVLSVGDIALLVGIITVMLLLDVRLALLTLSVMPVLFVVRLWWLPRARDAFMAAHETQLVANGALAEGSTVCARCRAWAGSSSTCASMTTRPTAICAPISAPRNMRR